MLSHMDVSEPKLPVTGTGQCANSTAVMSARIWRTARRTEGRRSASIRFSGEKFFRLRRTSTGVSSGAACRARATALRCLCDRNFLWSTSWLAAVCMLAFCITTCFVPQETRSLAGQLQLCLPWRGQSYTKICSHLCAVRNGKPNKIEMDR